MERHSVAMDQKTSCGDATFPKFIYLFYWPLLLESQMTSVEIGQADPKTHREIFKNSQYSKTILKKRIIKLEDSH